MNAVRPDAPFKRASQTRADRVRAWQAKEDPALLDVLRNTQLTSNPDFRRELRTQLEAIPCPEDDSDDDGYDGYSE